MPACSNAPLVLEPSPKARKRHVGFGLQYSHEKERKHQDTVTHRRPVHLYVSLSVCLSLSLSLSLCLALRLCLSLSLSLFFSLSLYLSISLSVYRYIQVYMPPQTYTLVYLLSLYIHSRIVMLNYVLSFCLYFYFCSHFCSELHCHIHVPAPPNYPVRCLKYHLIGTTGPLIEVHWGCWYMAPLCRYPTITPSRGFRNTLTVL